MILCRLQWHHLLNAAVSSPCAVWSRLVDTPPLSLSGSPGRVVESGHPPSRRNTLYAKRGDEGMPERGHCCNCPERRSRRSMMFSEAITGMVLCLVRVFPGRVMRQTSIRSKVDNQSAAICWQTSIYLIRSKSMVSLLLGGRSRGLSSGTKYDKVSRQARIRIDEGFRLPIW